MFCQVLEWGNEYMEPLVWGVQCSLGREPLSSLRVGLSGWGKVIPVMLVDPSSQMQRSPAIRSCMRIGALSDTGVDRCGSMGSGSVFSPWTEVLCKLFEALDM